MSMNWTNEDLERFEKARLEREAERKANDAALLKQWTADGWKRAQKDLSEGALLKNRRVYDNLGRVYSDVFDDGETCGEKHPKYASSWEKECQDAVRYARSNLTQDYLWRYLPRKVILGIEWLDHTTALQVNKAVADEWEDKLASGFVAGYLSAIEYSDDATAPEGMAEKEMDWEPYDPPMTEKEYNDLA